jgi:hypothetical protein
VGPGSFRLPLGPRTELQAHRQYGDGAAPAGHGELLVPGSPAAENRIHVALTNRLILIEPVNARVPKAVS